MKEIVLGKEIKMHNYFSKDLVDLLEGLLIKNRKLRFSLNEAKSHAFFKGIIWAKVEKCEYKPPINPKVKTESDMKNIDKKLLSIDIVSDNNSNVSKNFDNSFQK